MNKKALVGEIIDLYDTIENLKKELNKYQLQEPIKTEEIIEENEKEKAFKELEIKAKSFLFSKVINEWNLNFYTSVEVKENEGEFNFLTFEQWIKTVNPSKLLNREYEYLLETLTYTDIKNYFVDEFKSFYLKAVNDKKMEIVRAKKDE